MCSFGDRAPGLVFFFQAEDGIRDLTVTGVQTCALPISAAASRLLTPGDEKRELLEATGVGRVALLPFTAELARMGPEEFTRDVLLERFGVRRLVVGYDHGFGRGRSGDVDLLRRLGAGAGFEVDSVAAVRDGGQPVSSTLIRAAVAHGDLAEAERWLAGHTACAAGWSGEPGAVARSGSR